jgi:hypothetical protein
VEINYVFTNAVGRPPKPKENKPSRPRGRPRKEPEDRVPGRPLTYTEELADEICAWLSSGKTLTSYCDKPGKPSYTTIMNWLWKGSKWYKEDFSKKYDMARQMQSECLADSIMDIADESSGDWSETELKDGKKKVVFNPEAVQRSRLRMEARKWIASKMWPKKYGESSNLKVSGEGGGPVILKVVYEDAPKIPQEDN